MLIGLLGILIIAIFGIAISRRPDIFLRLQAWSVSEKDYPESSEEWRRAKLLHENPTEWLRLNPQMARHYKSVGYVAYLIAGGTIFMFLCRLMELSIPSK